MSPVSVEPQGLLDMFPLDLPPGQRVLALFSAKWTIGALRPLVELGVPDLLASSPKTAAQLAEATRTKADVLHRLLRATASAGIFREQDDGTYALTEYSETLRSGVTGGIREMFLFASHRMMWRPYEEVLHTARTGESAFEQAFGVSFFEYLQTDPASGRLFDQAMRQNQYPETDRILLEYDFGRFRRIADVGGGQGQFLAEMLGRHPGCAGVLCDQPQVVADAEPVFEQRGVADRVEIAAVDFFAELPKGCDAYFIKHTLHNWDDEHAIRILHTIRTAIGEDTSARLLIVDMLLTGSPGWDVGKLIDIEMLAALGGRERSRGEWNRVTEAAGFAPANDPAPGALALLEFRPV
ncbi:multifunctional cyclase/dehydratase/O-methyltransferase [Kibdelosporangium banguiense]|uniref:Multifunctional cyclase/dehydratase/O-methyltransferase n=1 Tax=Kibdelosporangium banguiense TaxID=1365924 RepID=A0ABS4TS94_9PSEU|nr:methyltransferase [Kibdelosporangium banguiense]MBP2327280.1 multifunctional cyclase/dehydratase/O-methyltransferase [Kibdelosporangium banguiense]